MDTDVGLARGEQLGYNRCNSTTEGPSSLCQTAYINSLDGTCSISKNILSDTHNFLLEDFCLWAPSIPGKTVGEIEGEMIAWCTRPGHGTRVMPDGTITGVQFTRSPDYVEVVGFMDQTKINMVAGDAGGEMDPHGADLVSRVCCFDELCAYLFAARQSSRWSLVYQRFHWILHSSYRMA